MKYTKITEDNYQEAIETLESMGDNLDEDNDDKVAEFEDLWNLIRNFEKEEYGL